MDILFYNLCILFQQARHWISSSMQYIKKMLHSYFSHHISAHKHSRSNFHTKTEWNTWLLCFQWLLHIPQTTHFLSETLTNLHLWSQLQELAVDFNFLLATYWSTAGHSFYFNSFLTSFTTKCWNSLGHNSNYEKTGCLYFCACREPQMAANAGLQFRNAMLLFPIKLCLCRYWFHPLQNSLK